VRVLVWGKLDSQFSECLFDFIFGRILVQPQNLEMILYLPYMNLREMKKVQEGQRKSLLDLVAKEV
jgi:hypothetical protein